MRHGWHLHNIKQTCLCMQAWYGNCFGLLCLSRSLSQLIYWPEKLWRVDLFLFAHMPDEGGICALCFWNSSPHVASVIRQSQSALALTSEGKKQLLRIIISVCLNLRENHTGGSGQLGWCQVSQPPKGVLNQPNVSKFIRCPRQVKANVKKCLQIVTTSSLDLVEISFFLFVLLTHASVFHDSFMLSPTLSDFSGVVNVTPFGQRPGEQTDNNT